MSFSGRFELELTIYDGKKIILLPHATKITTKLHATFLD
jgi:hypothetical protein